MVHTCWVFGCKNSSNKTDARKVSYFGIPLKNPNRIREWLDKIGRSNFSSKPQQFFKSKKVCSEHFETKMLSISNTKLKSNATPTIFKRECGYNGMNQFDAPSCPTVASSSKEQEQVNEENKSPNVKLPIRSVIDHDVPSCPTVAPSLEKQEQLNEENKSPNVELRSQLTKASKLSSSTTTTNRLRAQIKTLRRRNLKLEKSLELERKVTEELFINFCKENLGETMAAFFEMQLKLSKSKGKGSR